MKSTDEQKVRRGDQPATLKDVFLVLAVLVLLVLIFAAIAAVFPNLVSPDPSARQYATEASISRISSAVEKYRVDCGQWPSEAQGLVDLYTNAEAVAGWKGPYLSSEGCLDDSWGNPFKIVSEGQARTIVSAGPDEEYGTRDDILGAVLPDPRDR